MVGSESPLLLIGVSVGIIGAIIIARFVLVGLVIGIIGTIVAIIFQMFSMTKLIWIPILWLFAKGYVVFVKVAAITILLVGFLYAVGQGDKVTNLFSTVQAKVMTVGR